MKTLASTAAAAVSTIAISFSAAADEKQDPGSEAGAGLIRQSSPQIKSRGLDARVKHGHDMGFDQRKPSFTIPLPR